VFILILTDDDVDCHRFLHLVRTIADSLRMTTAACILGPHQAYSSGQFTRPST
jgi:hypothetical protein